MDERTPLRPSLLRCYTLLSMSFTRLRQLMARDPQQRGRGFAVLYQLQQVFMSFEENRSNWSNYSLLHQMMASINDMEAVAQVQSPGLIEIDGADVLEERLIHDPALQPEEEIPTDDERADAPVFSGELPVADEHGSLENMAGCMIGRLSRRIDSACISGSSSLRRYYAMRKYERHSACLSKVRTRSQNAYDAAY